MALTLVSRKNQPVPHSPVSSSQRSLPESALRQGIKGVERLAEGALAPLDITQAAIEGVGKPLAQAVGLEQPVKQAQELFTPEYVEKLHPSVRQKIGEFQKSARAETERPSKVLRGAVASVLPKDYLESENPVEKVIDSTISALPFRFILGAPDVSKALLQELGSSVGQVGAEQAGLGGVGQLVGGLAGAAAFGRLKDVISKESDPNKLAGLAQAAEKKFYDQERTLGAELHGDASSYRDALGKVGQEIENTSTLSSSQKNDLLDKIRLFKQDIQPAVVNDKWRRDAINASKILERKREINALWPEVTDKNYRKYLERIQDSMFKEADRLGEKNKDWLQAWKTGDAIHKARNFKFELTRLAEKIPGIAKKMDSPLAQMALGFGVGKFISPKSALIASTVIPAYKKAEQLYGFAQEPATRQLFSQAFKNVLDNNDKALASTLLKINTKAKRYEQMNPMQRPASGLKLVSRRS